MCHSKKQEGKHSYINSGTVAWVILICVDNVMHTIDLFYAHFFCIYFNEQRILQDILMIHNEVKFVLQSHPSCFQL